ncbi:MAG: PAS domain S-box protein [bacterium]
MNRGHHRNPPPLDTPASNSPTLGESEERYRIMFEHAPDAIVVVDLESGCFVKANSNACKLFGLSHERILQLGPVELSPEVQPDGQSSANKAAAFLNDAMEGKIPVFEWLHQNALGEEIPCELRLVRLPPFDRQLVRGSITDISERKLAEAEAARREREFRSLAENSPDWIVRVDRELRRTFVNRAVLEASEATLDDLLGKRPSESFPDEPDLRDWEVAMAEAMQEGKPVQFERQSSLDGGRFLQTKIVPEHDVHGRVVSALSITRDVTSVRRAGEAELRLATIVESASEAIMSCSLDGAITSWNGGAEQIFGYSAEEVIGKTFEFLFDPRGTEGLDEVRRHVLAGETISGDTRNWRRKDGTTVTTASVLFPLLDSEGTMVGTASVAHDVTSERAAAEAIERSELRLREALEGARIGAWSYNIATDVMEHSHVSAHIHQRTVEEMPKTMRGSLAMIHPDDFEVTRARVLGRALIPSEPREYRVQLLDGTYRWISGIGEISRPEADRISGLTVDIHERKVAELALKESEEQLHQIVDSLSAGVWVFDGEKIVMVNAAAERLTGYSRERLHDLDSLVVMLGEAGARDLLGRAHDRMRGEQPPDRYELPVVTANGEQRQMELTASLITYHGKPAVIVSAFDVTHRSIQEAALRQSEARFRSLVDNSPDYITRVDRELRVDFVNRTAERELGIASERVLGRRTDEMHFPGQLGGLFAARQQSVLESGEPAEFEYTVEGPEPTYFRTRMVPEFDEAGIVHHVLTVVTDITTERRAEAERKRLDLQMQHAQKMESLGVLAGGIAHDFNNLLVAILGNAGLALMELTPESPARQTVEDIELAAQRAAELTKQMLAYSGKGRFIVEPINLSRVVEEMAHLLTVSVSKRAELKYDFPAALPAIEGDATQIRQVVMNLIMNASDALGDHAGVISVSTGLIHADKEFLAGTYVHDDIPAGDYVFLEVADTGVGMDAETRARVFDPFFTTKFTGRGLGLAAVLGIVRGHKGTIKLYSEPGRGTTFQVLFPADGAVPGRSDLATEVSGGEGSAGRIILIVDDDATVRTVTRRILERAGFSVLLGEDGADGLRVYAEHPGIDLVLLDMTMPHMDGEETFRELLKVDPNVRVVLTSGYNEQDATENFTGKGLAGFMQKPYRPQELLAKVYETIGEEA